MQGRGMSNPLIDIDPTIITITRHAKVTAGGFTTLADTVLDPITVRAYRYSTHNQREYTDDTGEVKSCDIGIMAEPDADMVVGHDSYDTFCFEGRTYRVVGVRVYDSPDISNPCLQADCVAI